MAEEEGSGEGRVSYSPNWIIRGTWPHNMRGEDGEGMSSVLNISIINTANLIILFVNL